MLLEQAVKQGRERVGLSSDKPKLPAESLIRFWSNTVQSCPDKPAFSCLGQTLSLVRLISFPEGLPVTCKKIWG